MQNNIYNILRKKYNINDADDIAPMPAYYQVSAPEGFVANYNTNSGITYVDAPIKDDRKWFQKSGVFDDGYQFGDISRVILGTAQDVTENLTTGVVGMGEKAVDALAWIGADLSRKTTMDAAVAEIVFNALTGKETDGVLERNLALQEKIERDTSAFIQKDLYDEEAVSKKILSYTGLPNFNQRQGIDVETDSVLGEKSDALVQSGGQLLATAGLQMVGVPWWLTTGATSFGGEVENALNQGASFGEAGASAAISAGAEILTEKLSGGIKFGGQTLDDVLLKPLTERIASKGWKFLVDMGIDAVGEGAEEVISGFFSNLGTALYREEDLNDILFSEQAMDEYLEGFVGGAVLGGVGGSFQGLNPDAAQDVITKEYNDRVDEAQSDGKKLTAREKSRIYKDVVEDVESGAISTDRIEEILGGETYKNYKAESEAEKADREEYDKLYRTKNSDKSDADVERQAELKKRIEAGRKSTELRSQLDSEVLGLVKGTRLEESYNEKARRGQKFEADVSQYNEAQRKVIQSAIDSGILNNTNRTHRFVDMVAKISADKGVSFDFTNNAKLKDTGFAVDGAQVNAYVTKDGITLNINSAKALNSVVGHEIAHVLEGTELYSELQSLLFNYAESKGDLKNRRALIEKLYKNVKDANVDAEITADLIGDYLFTDRDFVRRLSVENKNVFQKIFDEIKYLARVATAGSKEARELERVKKMFEDVYREGGKASAEATVESELNEIGLEYDVKNETVSYSLSSLEDTFGLKKGAIAESVELDGNYKAAEDYIRAREEYVNALAKSIALDKNNITDEEYAKANNYLDGLFLIGEMIAKDTDRLDYEAAVDKSSWVSNSEYGGSIDFSTLCAKRRLFTGTFDAIQNQLPDTVLNENDFLQIRNMLLEKDLESPCSMCYVEGSRAKHGEYVAKFLKEYLATDPEWKPQIADFTSSVRLEQTRINHPEAYNAYTKAMNKLAQRKPKEASVRTDYKGEILVAFEDGSSVEIKNQNGGIRFNSFSDFEIIHALDCMQVITDMARVGLNGQAYTKVAEFAEAFGNTGLKINLSLVAKDVDANGKLIFDEVNGMKYSEAMRLRNEYSENVGTVIVAFNEAQIRAALADKTIDYVLPFHRSQWKKSQYTMMGLPNVTKDFTMQQNDRIRNPKTGKPVKLSKLKHISTYTNDITGKSYEIMDNIMPNQYWDWNASGRENAQRYLDYINSNGMTPKFDFLLEKVDGKWTLPEGDVGDGYFKLLIDFKMYDNDGWGSPQRPVLPEFNMSYIQKMLNNYTGGHQAFPVAHDVVDEFVKTKTGAKYSLSENTQDNGVEYAPVRNAASAPIADQTTAEILTEEPTVTKRKNNAWKWAKEHILDRGMVFEDLSLKTGNRELQARWNSIRYADKKAQKLIGDGDETTKSLKSIQERVEKSGKTKQFYAYLYHMHNADRMTLANRFPGVENKPVFGNSVTAEMSREITANLLKNNPEFKQWAEDVYAYNRRLRSLLVQNGVISIETAKLWEQMYPHYVPIRREGDVGLNVNVPLDTGRTGVNAPVKRATGGNANILPLFDTMGQRTMQTYKAIAKNRFGVELMNTLGTTIENQAVGVDEAIDSIDTQDSLLQEGINGMNPTFTVFENGEKVTFEITDEMYEALKPTSELFASTSKALNTASNIRRSVLTEYNPWFMLKNAVKDVQDVLINSQHPAKTYAAIPSAIREIRTNGRWYQEYMANGGEQNTYFDKQSNTFTKENPTLEAMKKWSGLNFIQKANNIVEMIPRLSEYIASRESGRSIDVAMLDAARVTTNFAAGGDATKWLNRNGATFLNASVQGVMQQARNIREAKMNGLRGWASLAAKFTIAGLPAIILNNLIWDDDEDYEELSDYVKEGYYIVGKFDDGKFVRIPKGRTVAVIQNAFEQISNAITGDDEVDLKAFVDLVISNLAPNNPLENNIFSPIVQVAKNETWYGEDLVPSRLQDLPAGEQYDESTDMISRWLGETFNISPYKVNYLIDQYSGVIGDTFLPMLTPEAESGNDSFLGNMIAPLKDMFITDSVMKNQNVSDFYETKDELAVNAKASNATDEDILKYKYLNTVNAELSDLYKQKREIQNSDLPDAEKYAQVREIQRQIDAITKNAMETYESVNIEGENYATLGDYHYRKNENGEWQRITDEQLEKQNAVTSSLNITPSEYWSNKEEYDYAYKNMDKYNFLKENGITYEEYKNADDDFKDAYTWAYENPDGYVLSKVVAGDVVTYKQYSNDLNNIHADKDANGKSISGSRKSKVLEYINNMDIDYGQKLILFKYEYPSTDTYNYEIIEYLNSRDDISYSEMKTILIELGFTVDANGNISW